MGLFKGVYLILTLILTAKASDSVGDQQAGDRFAEPRDGEWAAERRIWTGRRTETRGGEVLEAESSSGVVHGGDFEAGGWPAVAPPTGVGHGEGYDTPWDIYGSESELVGAYSGDRVRWMPSKSRYRPRTEQPLEDSAEIPIQEHQRRQRLQLQQQLLRRGVGMTRGTMQLENLGGGILVGDDDEEDEEEEEEEEEEEVRPPPPRQPPTRKLPSLRPPNRANDDTPVKSPHTTDLKSILKMTGPLSLSEILQRKNLSLEELLRGSRLALSAISQTPTGDGGNGASRTEQRRRRPPSPVTRPQLKRRRPTPAIELTTFPPQTTTMGTTTTTKPRTTTRSNIITTTEEATAITDSPDFNTVHKIKSQTIHTPSVTSTETPGSDILEIILQEDEADGPSLAEVLSSRNMTVADLIEQRERASRRGDITALFPAPSFIKDPGDKVTRNEEKVVSKEGSSRNGRKFTNFDLTEADWNVPPLIPNEHTPEDSISEEEIDQQVTQSRNTYQIIPSNEAIIQYPIKVESSTVSIQHPSIHELPTFHTEGHRPIVRTRVTAPTSTTEEALTRLSKALNEPEQRHSPEVKEEFGYREEEQLSMGLPQGVKSAIIASSSLLGIALLIFLSIFAVFRYRQWRRRRGLGPYLCVAVLEAAAGGKKGKGPKIVKQGQSKDRGWGDTIDSAQARLWRTLRRGHCRFYDKDNGQT